ncbi:MAG: DUF4097 family beta strand repeat-containing protein [Candidatus Latescibacterota bacterium]|jgi:hypothetical protein
MRKSFVLLVVCCLVIAQGVAYSSDIERRETATKTLRFGTAAGDKRVIVDNVFGSIDVTGYDGEVVEMTVHKTLTARSEKKAEEAEDEVTLKIYEDDDVIELYVDGPFRERYGRGSHWRGYKREGYKVNFDFEVKVPRGCAVELSTINNGDISASQLKGEFDVSNVNGAIELKGMSGSGDVYTVNGKLTVEYDENPQSDCSFGTVNGDVRLYFQRGLSADFYMKTMNGEVYTDFDVAALPVKTSTSQSRNGKKVYKVGHMTGVRAGRGGPEIEMKTLNGDMYILSGKGER